MSSDSVSVGSATPASITVSFDAQGASVSAISFDITYDATNLSFDNSTFNPGVDNVAAGCTPDGSLSFPSCGEGGAPGTITVGGFGSPTTVVTIALDASAAPAGSYPVTVTNATYSDGTSDIPIADASGTVTVSAGPQLTADPSADFGSVTVGDTGSTSVGVGATGGAVGSIACTLGGADAASFAITAAPPASLTDGQTVDVGLSCSPTAIGALSATFDCTSDANSTSTALSCTGAAGTAEAESSPASGSSVIISGLIAGGTGSTSITFTETNGQGVDYTVDSCTLATGAPFSVDSTFPLTVASGGSAAVTVTATNVTDPTVTDTLTCTATVNGAAQTFTYNLGVAFRPLVVPTLQQWGLILLALALGAVGFMTLRRRDELA